MPIPKPPKQKTLHEEASTSISPEDEFQCGYSFPRTNCTWYYITAWT